MACLSTSHVLLYSKVHWASLLNASGTFQEFCWLACSLISHALIPSMGWLVHSYTFWDSLDGLFGSQPHFHIFQPHISYFTEFLNNSFVLSHTLYILQVHQLACLLVSAPFIPPHHWLICLLSLSADPSVNSSFTRFTVNLFN